VLYQRAIKPVEIVWISAGFSTGDPNSCPTDQELDALTS
jgi:hypothetical protein